MTLKNYTRTFFVVAAVAMVGLVTTSANADLVIHAAAPMVNGADIANLTWDSDGGQLTKTFTDTLNPGQSFTTGANAGGYTLNSFSLQTHTPSQNDGHGAREWEMRVIAISGSGAGATSTTVAQALAISQAPGTFAVADWFTWSFDSPVALSANTVYGIDVEHSLSDDWRNGITYFRHNNADNIAGGHWYVRGDGDPGTFSDYTRTGRDFVFHVDLTATAVPEPASLALLGLGSVVMLVRRRRRG